MKYIPVHVLLLMLVFHPSCRGQNKSEIPKRNIESGTSNLFTSNVPKSGVFEIKQDNKGIIWLATNDGVYKYDGISFTNITSKVSSARFISVLENKKGNFWFATLGSGIFFYDGKSFQNYTTNDGLASNRVSCMYEDRSGNIWFGTTDGASRYDGKTFQTIKMTEAPAGNAMDSVHSSVYQQLLPRNSSLHNDIHSIIEDKGGKLWFGTRGNTFVYDGKTFTTVTSKDGRVFTNVWRIIEDKKGNIWFGDEGLWRYNGSAFSKINQSGAGVIVEDKKGNILAGSGGSIFRYDEQSLSDEKPHVSEIKTNGPGLKNLPFGILGANDGSIWFSSGGGVSRFDGTTITDFKNKAVQE